MPASFLPINQGPQDSLLFDNTRSYFTNVGYTRTSNFQMELRDIDPQNNANLGGKVDFVIPKAGDLLGPVDLMVEFNKVNAGPGSGEYWGWVESIGHAMIEKITFSVGSHDVETLTGDHLNIMNELMRSDTHRYAFNQIGKTGRPLVRGEMGAGGTATAETYYVDTGTSSDTCDRLIAYDSVVKDGKKLIIPLGLFFTTHPSKYFPLAAIAGNNEVRISVKFRTLNELLHVHGNYTAVDDSGSTGGIITAAQAAQDADAAGLSFTGSGGAFASAGCKLRCHYIHVTGPEATQLMNREHVRLMKLWHGNEITKQFSITCSPAGTATTLELDLSFLHPVVELVITIRKVSDMGSSIANNIAIGTGDKPTANTAQTKNYFAYHGGGKDPNMDSWNNCIEENGVSAAALPTYLKSTTFNLKLNGQSTHLDGAGIDREYLMNRLMPMLHSNANEEYGRVAESSIVRGAGRTDSNANPVASTDLDMLSQLKDRKEIYVYPFALNPEGANPSGSTNFSKVSHAKLSIGVSGFAPSATTTTTDDYQVDVYGVYYNWLAIKDGRALISFA
jgi:hypothetical protein